MSNPNFIKLVQAVADMSGDFDLVYLNDGRVIRVSEDKYAPTELNIDVFSSAKEANEKLGNEARDETREQLSKLL